MSQKKQDFENVKKTAEAYETLDEETALAEAQDSEKVAEKLIEKEVEKKEIKSLPTLKIGRNQNYRNGENKKEFEVIGWNPRTKLGMDVKSGKVNNIDSILGKNQKILEPEIVDFLINLKSDLNSIGQSKGKFGGGKRRAWRQTQRKTEEGNVPTFSTMAVVGDENGHVGIGVGKAKETLPARDKAIRQAKLNIIKITRGCSAFDCSCSEPHTIPFKVEGKAGSARVTLIPAPQGTGLVVGNELKKILRMAGIKDLYSRTTGRKRTTFNIVKACIDGLRKTTERNTI